MSYNVEVEPINRFEVIPDKTEAKDLGIFYNIKVDLSDEPFSDKLDAESFADKLRLFLKQNF